ncbi:MAG: exodeoxyribonuclease III [Gammaproteobacteria bacterium]
MTKIATWNVNSLRVRLPQVLDWLKNSQADILALQETKLLDGNFPVDEIADAGYHAAYSGQKTYNGVAIISKNKAGDIDTDLPGLDDPQRRVLCATIGDVRVLDVYIPNGESIESDKYQYKLDWLDKLIAYVEIQLKQHEKFVILGDFNIAPEAIDTYDAEKWQGKVLFSDPERNAFQRLISEGLTDTFRLFNSEEKQFSWWDYRMASFRRNLGMRIDHILVSEALSKTCNRCEIDKIPRSWERPSDHTPVIAEFID